MSLITVHICYLCTLLCTEIIIMTAIVASVTGIIILYIKTYEDDEDYYSYPIQAGRKRDISVSSKTLNIQTLYQRDS